MAPVCYYVSEKGFKRGEVAMVALSTNRDNAPDWRFPDTFDTEDRNGFWQRATTPVHWRKVGNLLPHALATKKPGRPMSDPVGGAGSITNATHTGKRIRHTAREFPDTRAPRNSTGISLCCDYNSRNVRRLSADSRHLDREI